MNEHYLARILHEEASAWRESASEVKPSAAYFLIARMLDNVASRLEGGKLQYLGGLKNEKATEEIKIEGTPLAAVVRKRDLDIGVRVVFDESNLSVGDMITVTHRDGVVACTIEVGE